MAYSSRALSAAECNYAQIEKELLAVVFGMEHFDHFTYGREIRVESDHKPLQAPHGCAKKTAAYAVEVAEVQNITHLQARKRYAGRRYSLARSRAIAARHHTCTKGV